MNDATYLRQAIIVLRERIRLRLSGEKTAERHEHAVLAAEKALEEVRNGLSRPPALDRVAKAFGLTDFERDILVLCAGVELDAELVALVHQFPGSFASFVEVMHDDSEPEALAPSGTLRKSRLVVAQPANGMATGRLVIRERILFALQGVDAIDETLAALLRRQTIPDVLARPHEAAVEEIEKIWSEGPFSHAPTVVLLGEDRGAKRAVAAKAAHSFGLTLYVLSAADIPVRVLERDELLSVWLCETALSPCALYIDADDTQEGAILQSAGSFAARLSGPVFWSGRALPPGVNDSVFVDVPRLGLSEQRQLWQQVLGPVAVAMGERMDIMVGSFRLGVENMHRIAAQAAQHFDDNGVVDFNAQLWNQCRRQARPRLNELAERMATKASWSDLVLPTPEIELLQGIVAQASQRVRVFEDWGFGEKCSRGFGLSALFAGISGTGKTMAAEILANELNLDLYRVDLSRVVSKYIGETEKNLARIFDAADEGGVVLLFDEADALFGKRSDVQDSHDRYANIEVSYLLQRMESYQGVAILTTNLKQALDTAFLRRLRYVVTFPFPDFDQRAEIWRRVFPRQTPTEGLDFDKLGRLALAGGNLRTIALNAAFLAADAGEPVRMTHVSRAARAECLKLEKEVFLPEIASWG